MVETADAHYTRQELLDFGFTAVGEPVWVSRKASLYAISGRLGDRVRVDDFCVLKGRLEVGDRVHIGAFCSLSGVGGVIALGDCCALGTHVSIFTASDDFRADALNGNLVPQELVKTVRDDVRVGRAAMVGPHSVVLPGVTVGDAAAVGAQCVLSQSVEPGTLLISGAARGVAVGRRDVAKILALADRVAADKGRS